MQAINTVTVYEKKCPICLDEDILSKEIATADPSQPIAGVLVLSCGHPVHVSCLQNCDSYKKVTNCFSCKRPIRRDWIPQTTAAQVFQAGYDRSPTLVSRVSLSLFAITISMACVISPTAAAAVVGAACSAATLNFDTTDPTQSVNSTAVGMTGVAASIAGIAAHVFEATEVVRVALCVGGMVGVISAYCGGHYLGRLRPVRCLVGSLAVAQLVAGRALHFLGDSCRRSLRFS